MKKEIKKYILRGARFALGQPIIDHSYILPFHSFRVRKRRKRKRKSIFRWRLTSALTSTDIHCIHGRRREEEDPAILRDSANARIKVSGASSVRESRSSCVVSFVPCFITFILRPLLVYNYAPTANSSTFLRR